MNKILLCTLITVVSMAAFDSFAKSKRASNLNDPTCDMVETATLGVSFNQIPVALDGFQAYINSKRDKIFKLAADLEISDIVLHNINYNIIHNNQGGYPSAEEKYYVMNGGLSFKMKDANKVPLLMEKVSALGFQVNFNMNAYRQCR
ncbi:MAG: hypothetical protein COA45_09950 [Zetaproteobacteria bacterium]|nr:MAG: hypothetical protein COA45_09950 [Zetaproteobacteria bacterium]